MNRSSCISGHTTAITESALEETGAVRHLNPPAGVSRLDLAGSPAGCGSLRSGRSLPVRVGSDRGVLTPSRGRPYSGPSPADQSHAAHNPRTCLTGFSNMMLVRHHTFEV